MLSLFKAAYFWITPHLINEASKSYDKRTRFSPDPDISTAIYGMASLLMVHGDSYQDYAKLFFWCFLASYSE
ncbi:MAG: hypothetical protein ACJA0Z_003061, partial [Halioglobus sp.]